MSKPLKVVYLFGAGATHAEKLLACQLKKQNIGKSGLRNDDVSERVMNHRGISKIVSRYSLDIDKTVNKQKIVDIEFLITLIESIKTKESNVCAQKLRKYYKDDILTQLKVNGVTIKPRLYSALIELQELNKKKEEVLGYLTLNYDSLFEDALKRMRYKIQRGFSLIQEGSTSQTRSVHNHNETLLLNLHGSFNWLLNKNHKIVKTNDATGGEAMWIPPGLNKEYIEYPYDLIFGKAREILLDCDQLRIVGCSLSSNDLGLTSLIFRTQKSREKGTCSIKLVDSDYAWIKLKERLGSVLNFEPSFYEEGRSSSGNPLLDWLSLKTEGYSQRTLKRTRYLRNVRVWAYGEN